MEGNMFLESWEASEHTWAALASSLHPDTLLWKWPQNKKIHIQAQGKKKKKRKIKEKKERKRKTRKEKRLFAALLFPAAKLIGSYSCCLYAGSTPTAPTLIGVQIAGSGPRCLGKDE